MFKLQPATLSMVVERQARPIEDEVNLRAYAELLWRRRHIVAWVTLAAITVAAIISLFILQPRYEASAVLLLTQPRFQSTAAGLQTPSPVLTVDTLIPLIHNNVVAAQAAARLGDTSPRAPMNLVRRVKFSSVRGTNLVRLTARGSTAGGALAVARAWSEAVVEYVDSLGLEETRRTISLLEERVASAAKDLIQAEKVLRDFRADSKIPILEQQVEEIVRRIALYETRLAEVQQGGAPAGGEVMLEPNGKNYSLTVTSVRDPARLRRILTAHRDNLAAFQQPLATERQREIQLLRQVEFARSTYELLVQKREEMRIMLGANSGMVKIAVPPVLPDSPAGPKTAVNLTLAAILGLIAGSVLAFALDYFVAPGAVKLPHPVSGAPSRHQESSPELGD